MYQYKSNDGLCQSNNCDFINLWNSIVSKHEHKEKNWISNLRSNHVKAAHPDDGWVNRKNNSVQFVYPQFNDGVNVNDIIALGNEDKYRLVKIINIEDDMFNQREYYFC